MEDSKAAFLVKAEKSKQYIAAISVFFGSICIGTVLGWTSPALPQLLEEKIIHQDQEGIVGSMLALGALVSALPGGYLADKIGRKKALLYSIIPFMINWIMIITANGPYMLYAARFSGGIACGMNAVCSLMYIGEIAEPSMRGILASFCNLSACIGILLTTITGAFLQWRWMSTVLASIPIIHAICMLFVPETPIYLLKKGEADKARKVLRYFRGEYYKNIEVELNEMQELINNTNKKVNLREALKSKSNRKAVVIAVCIMFFQQHSGINAVTFYTVPIFLSTDSAFSPDLAAIIVNVMQLLCSVLPIIIIEKMNRKFYLKISSLGSAMCLIALGMYFHFKILGISSSSIDILPLVGLILLIIVFGIGLGPIPWMIISELFAPEIKAIGSGFAIIATWISIYIVTFTFPLMTTYLGSYVAFYFYAIVLIVATFFIHFCVPETRGRSLHEIQEMLKR